MEAYLDMIDHVLRYGTRKENRTGVDTLSIWAYMYRIEWASGHPDDAPPDGSYPILGEEVDTALPLLTTKEISWKNIIVELLWFLSGETNLSFLRRHGCKFWDPWADENGYVPSAYGNFWRHFPVPVNWPTSGGRNDQISWVLDELRRNPSSRRMVVSAWAPGNAQTSKLPPCHVLFALNVQNLDEPRLCMHLTQRSCDLALGVPYNMASYATLLQLFCHLSGLKPGVFAHSLLDLHAYTAKPDGSMAEYDHLPGLREQLNRCSRALPRLTIDPSIRELADVDALMRPDVPTNQILEAFKLEGYTPHPKIPFKVAV